MMDRWKQNTRIPCVSLSTKEDGGIWPWPTEFLSCGGWEFGIDFDHVIFLGWGLGLDQLILIQEDGGLGLKPTDFHGRTGTWPWPTEIHRIGNGLDHRFIRLHMSFYYGLIHGKIGGRHHLWHKSGSGLNSTRGTRHEQEDMVGWQADTSAYRPGQTNQTDTGVGV